MIKLFTRLFTTCLLFLMLSEAGIYAQDEGNLASKISVRSGLSGGFGFSHLHVNDAYLPRYATSEYLDFGYDFCVYAGALVVVDPGFAIPLEFAFDPAFSKYSYGNLEGMYTDTIYAAADIDMEALRIPLSVRYTFLESKRLKPFVKAGGAFAFFVDTEAYFSTKILTENKLYPYEYRQFSYSNYQNSLFLGIGLELDYTLADYTLELVLEQGDGLHSQKYGSSFLKASRTTTISLQFGVLF